MKSPRNVNSNYREGLELVESRMAKEDAIKLISDLHCTVLQPEKRLPACSVWSLQNAWSEALS